MSEKPARAIKLNVINEPKENYKGGPSSLCPGCGHDQISSVIVNAAWENGIKPENITEWTLGGNRKSAKRTSDLLEEVLSEDSRIIVWRNA